VAETQDELNEERDSRRKLEEWADYLESQLHTCTESRSLVEKQYVLSAAFTSKISNIASSHLISS